jgi:hypothetical protein
MGLKVEFYEVIWSVFKQHYTSILFANLDADLNVITNAAIEKTKIGINKEVEEFLINKIKEGKNEFN